VNQTPSGFDMKLSKPAIWLVLCWLLCPQLLRAQQNCVDREVDVNVLNNDGQVVERLSAADFKGFVHRKPVEIVSVVWDQNPHRVLILLDGRGLATTPETWTLALDRADKIVTRMPAATEIGLIAFTWRSKHNLDFTTDRQEILGGLRGLRTIANVKPRGHVQNALWKAISESLRSFAPPRHGDVLYVVSDGVDSKSEVDWGGLENSAVASGIRVFAFQVQWLIGGSPMRVVGSTHELKELVDATGGYLIMHFQPLPKVAFSQLGPKMEDDLAGLDRQFRQIIGYYRVEVRVPQPVDKPEKWDLRVIGRNNANNSVVYPQILASCSAVDRSSSQAQ
jgi:hypothetical protein